MYVSFFFFIPAKQLKRIFQKPIQFKFGHLFLRLKQNGRRKSSLHPLLLKHHRPAKEIKRYQYQSLPCLIPFPLFEIVNPKISKTEPESSEPMFIFRGPLIYISSIAFEFLFVSSLSFHPRIPHKRYFADIEFEKPIKGKKRIKFTINDQAEQKKKLDEGINLD